MSILDSNLGSKIRKLFSKIILGGSLSSFREQLFGTALDNNFGDRLLVFAVVVCCYCLLLVFAVGVCCWCLLLVFAVVVCCWCLLLLFAVVCLFIYLFVCLFCFVYLCFWLLLLLWLWLWLLLVLVVVVVVVVVFWVLFCCWLLLLLPLSSAFVYHHGWNYSSCAGSESRRDICHLVARTLRLLGRCGAPPWVWIWPGVSGFFWWFWQML